VKRTNKDVEPKKKVHVSGISEIRKDAYSISIIRLLKRLSYKQTDIARIIGKTASYVSHVNRGRYEFTMDDLININKKTGIPVFLLLLEATDENDVEENFRPIYEVAKKFFTHSAMAKILAKEVLK